MKMYLPPIVLIALLHVAGADVEVIPESPEPVTVTVQKPQVSEGSARDPVETIVRRGTLRNTPSRLRSVNSEEEYASDTAPLLLHLGSFSRLNTIENIIEISTAQVLPEDEIVISAGIMGKLTRLRVKTIDPVTGKEVYVRVREGLNVREDQEIGTIDDSVELRQIAAAKEMLAVAIAEENKHIEVEFAKASLTVAVAEVEKNRIMNENIPNTISAQMVLEAHLKRVQSLKQYEKALYDLEIVKPAERKVKEAELAIAETRLDQRRLVSPVNGIVEEVIGKEGEWFREGQPILRITRYDTLKIKGRVNINYALPRTMAGKTVSITAPPLGKEPPLSFTGKVFHASETVEADNHYTILVEVKNKLEDGFWVLNPGRYVDLKINL